MLSDNFFQYNLNFTKPGYKKYSSSKHKKVILKIWQNENFVIVNSKDGDREQKCDKM